jgi:uncharacterized peroxidase-related enzyme
MQVIQSIQTEYLSGPAKRLLETVNDEAGMASNMMKTMARSPHTLEGYLQLSRALAGGRLDATIREQIALAVAQANLCEYSLAQHASLAARLGLTTEEILASREGRSDDEKTNVVLRFARNLVVRRGECSTAELRDAGWGDEEIVDIIGQVALNVFANYFNLVARTEVDFPRIALKAMVA